MSEKIRIYDLRYNLNDSNHTEEFDDFVLAKEKAKLKKERGAENILIYECTYEGKKKLACRKAKSEICIWKSDSDEE